MSVFFLFFMYGTATTEFYTLSLHDALPIWTEAARQLSMRSSKCSKPLRTLRRFSVAASGAPSDLRRCAARRRAEDRKSTRLNSIHPSISYAVFCLKKKKKKDVEAAALI